MVASRISDPPAGDGSRIIIPEDPVSVLPVQVDGVVYSSEDLVIYVDDCGGIHIQCKVDGADAEIGPFLNGFGGGLQITTRDKMGNVSTESGLSTWVVRKR